MSLVRLEIRRHTAVVTLNRPEKRNALNRALLAELQQTFEDLHLEKRVRAVVLTGAGNVFCAGMDLGEMLETSKQPNAAELWHGDAAAYRDLVEFMLRFPKPIIAAVNGPAIAGGAGLVLACDITVAAQEAAFGLPEPLRGIVAGLVAPLLTFRIGGGQAARLLLGVQTIDAREAHRIGLFHEIVSADSLAERADAIAAQCARCAPPALLQTKRMLNETIGEQMLIQLGAGAAASATARTTEEAREGLAAFLEKREPKWP
ncbi:MAG: enoyl-CoA hydratase/isomerase family protein [Planctomycetes bacterium]|nr:enoyl-CoA hydratase/isomerase family protein [Planctomycetota bacterium]